MKWLIAGIAVLAVVMFIAAWLVDSEVDSSSDEKIAGVIPLFIGIGLVILDVMIAASVGLARVLFG